MVAQTLKRLCSHLFIRLTDCYYVAHCTVCISCTIIIHHSSSLFGMHHQCVAPLPANSPHSGLSIPGLILLNIFFHLWVKYESGWYWLFQFHGLDIIIHIRSAGNSVFYPFSFSFFSRGGWICKELNSQGKVVEIARKWMFKERFHNSHPCELARNGFIQEIKKWN